MGEVCYVYKRVCHVEGQRREAEIGISTAMAFNDVQLGKVTLGGSVAREEKEHRLSHGDSTVEGWGLRDWKENQGKKADNWLGRWEGAKSVQCPGRQGKNVFPNREGGHMGSKATPLPGGASASTARSSCQRGGSTCLCLPWLRRRAQGMIRAPFQRAPSSFTPLSPCAALWSQGGTPSECGQCLR